MQPMGFPTATDSAPAELRTAIKFCGLTRVEDVEAAVALGVDAIGIVLVPGSRRCRSLDDAAVLAEAAEVVPVVLLFRDPLADDVRRAIAAVKPAFLQFHGTEPQDFCQQFGVPWLKAIAMGSGDTKAASREARAHDAAAAWVFDGHCQGADGGRGAVFDWATLPRIDPQRLVIAGGLTPDNVAAAIDTLGPVAVDVASGIESEPGRKSVALMRRFIEEVRVADHRR